PRRSASRARSCAQGRRARSSPPRLLLARRALLTRGMLPRAPVGLLRPARQTMAALRQKLEAQRARDRRRLDQPHAHAIAEPIALAAADADERMPVLVVAEIFGADRARRDEPVGAGVVEL